MVPTMDPLPNQPNKRPVYLLVLVLVGAILVMMGLWFLRTQPSSDTLLESRAVSQKELVVQLASVYAQDRDIGAARSNLPDWDAQALANLFARLEVNEGDPVQRDQLASLRRALGLPVPQITSLSVLAQPPIIVASSVGLLLVLVAFVMNSLPVIDREDDLFSQILAASPVPEGPQVLAPQSSAQTAPTPPGGAGQPAQQADASQAKAAQPSTALPQQAQAQAPAGQPQAQPGQAQAPAGQAQAQPGQAQALAGQPQAQPGQVQAPAGQAQAQPGQAQAPAGQAQAQAAKPGQPPAPGQPAPATSPGAQPAAQPPQPEAAQPVPEAKKETNAKDVQGILADVFGEDGTEDAEMQTLTQGLSEVDVTHLMREADRLRETLRQRNSPDRS